MAKETRQERLARERREIEKASRHNDRGGAVGINLGDCRKRAAVLLLLVGLIAIAALETQGG